MKRGTPSHPKTFALAAKLGVPVYAAVGILEMLWHFAEDYAMQGDIGKHSDDVISKAVGWDGSTSVLIQSLVECRWLDQCPYKRLMVHDWSDHCTDYLKKKVKRYGLTFYGVSGQITDSVQTKSGLFSPGMAWNGEERRGEEGDPDKVQTKSRQSPDTMQDDVLGDVVNGFDRHLKHSNFEHRDAVVKTVMSMNGEFDVTKFRNNHPIYCDYHDQRNDWSYTTLTFLGWIRAGMPLPVPAKGKPHQPSDTRYVD